LHDNAAIPAVSDKERTNRRDYDISVAKFESSFLWKNELEYERQLKRYNMVVLQNEAFVVIFDEHVYFMKNNLRCFF
jgi:hypothetical protein